MEIILVRHAETAFDSGEPRFRGQVNISLSESGWQGAESLGKYLHKKSIDKIYYSKQKCNQETASKIKEYQVLTEMIEEPLLCDMSFGEWAGRLVSDVFPNNSDYEHWLNNPEKVIIPGGDKIEEVMRRVRELITKLKTNSPNSCVVLVSHKIVLALILCELFGLEPKYMWRFELSKGSISKLIFLPNGDFLLHELNRTCHLAEYELDKAEPPKLVAR